MVLQDEADVSHDVEVDNGGDEPLAVTKVDEGIEEGVAC